MEIRIGDIDCERLLKRSLARGGDFAEIYFEHRRGTSIICEAHRIEKFLVTSESGVAMRVVMGDRSAFAYTNDASSLDDLADTVASAVRAGSFPGGISLRKRSPVSIVQMDIDPEEIGRNYPVAVGIEADAKAGLAALATELKRLDVSKPSRAEELTKLKESVAVRTRAVGPQADYAMAIREALPDDAFVLSEMTQVGYWSNMAFPVYEPRTYITPGYQGTLGMGFTTALGAKAVSYTHLRAHETVLDLVCRLLLEKKKKKAMKNS